MSSILIFSVLFIILVLIRLASLENTIRDTGHQHNKGNLEDSKIKITTQQKETELIMSSTLETIWAVSVSIFGTKLLT